MFYFSYSQLVLHFRSFLRDNLFRRVGCPSVCPSVNNYVFSISFKTGQGQVWGAYAGAVRRRVHLVSMSTTEGAPPWYSFGLLLAIAQADARPVMLISLIRTPPDATMKSSFMVALLHG